MRELIRGLTPKVSDKALHAAESLKYRDFLTVMLILKDRKKFEALIARPEADLMKPFRWGTGQNLLREALLVADHAAYHTGELVVLRRLLGIWKK